MSENVPQVHHSESPLVLMDSGVSMQPKLPADVRIAGRRQDFDLPVWRDGSGDIRIGLPKVNPQHSGDMDQLVFSVADLLTVAGRLLNA